MAKSQAQDGKKPKKSKVVRGVELRPVDYQPSKAELEAEARLPATFDRVVETLFEGDKGSKNGSAN